MNDKWKVFFKKTGVCAAFLLIVGITLFHQRREQLADGLAEKIIRFHVRANSDSPEDQQLKLEVRDAIGAYMEQELAEAENLAQSRRIVLRDLTQIEAVARRAVQQAGYDYEVSARLAWVAFPTKTYGACTFPAGEYEALQVVIGAGEGKNWWCVMYPNLCFQGSVYEVEDDKVEESLREVLTAKEYDAVMKSGEYEIGFKWLTFLERFF